MTGKIYITGTLGDFEEDGKIIKGISLLDIVSQVKAQPEATAFEVFINSEGGYVHIGFDILNYLRSLGKPVTTIGTGIVASAATIIFMAGTERKLLPNTQFMIHLPWGEAVGTADEVEEYVKSLRAAEKQLLDFYKKELGVESEVIQPLLRDESWLTLEQLDTLGFTTSQPLPLIARAFLKTTNNKKDMTENDKNFFEGLFEKILGKFKGEVKNKIVQDATGAELDFGELADDAVIEVGATATVDGNPAEGEYTMPDGQVYVFEAGELKEIKPAEEDEMAALKDENESLKQQLADAQAKATEDSKKKDQLIDDIRKDVLNLKAQIKSKFKFDHKKEGNKKGDAGNPENRFEGVAERVKNRNKK